MPRPTNKPLEQNAEKCAQQERTSSTAKSPLTLYQTQVWPLLSKNMLANE